MASLFSVNMSPQGDIGGIGVSRWWFERSDHAAPGNSDCNNAAGAVAAFYNAIKAYIPQAVSIVSPDACEVFDVATGAPTAITAITSVPSAVVGSDSLHYGAGLGARMNLFTGQVIGRRFLRGAIMLVPLGGAAFGNTNGAVVSGAMTTIVAAWATLGSTTAADNIAHEVWHRPVAKTGGIAYNVTAVSVSPTPAGLRSRRS